MATSVASEPVADPQSKPLLKAQEAARMLGVRVAKVRDWARSGVLTPIRAPGSHPLYRRAQIEAILAGDGDSAA